MAHSDESQLAVVVLPAPDAAIAVRRAWDRGDAVAVVDPGHPDLGAHVAALDPALVIDRDGQHRRAGGRRLPAGAGAVVATSGTTGRPRLVLLDRAALQASAIAVAHALAIDPDADRWLACVPLHHIAGLAILARAHTTGTPLTVHAGFDAATVAAAAGPCTVVSLVPTTLHRLLDHDPTAVARFRCILLGGASVSDELRERAAINGLNVVTTYGLTETGGGCVHDGHPLDGVEVTLDAETDEILVRGRVVMRGYLATRSGDERDLDPSRDGWLATGDIGTWDAAGRLVVVDRRKDLVITGGVNVSPSAVETRLAGAPGVADIAVVGTSDAEWGERVVACVIAHGPAPTLAELRAYGTSKGLTAAELPRELRVVTEIPRSTGGKVLRRELRR